MIDYLEGFLIGPIWSDTDYRTRRHYFAHIFLAALMGTAFVLLLLFPDSMSKWVIIQWPLCLILLIILLLVTPIFSSIYYRVPFVIRIFFLLLYATKYVLLFYTLVHTFFPLIAIDKENIPALLLARVDDRVTQSLDRISDSGKIFTTVLGVIMGAFWVIAEGLLVVVILIAVPLAAISLMKGIRYALDIGLFKLIDRYVIKRSPVPVNDIPWLGGIGDDTETRPAGSVTPKPFARQQESRYEELPDDVLYSGGEEDKLTVPNGTFRTVQVNHVGGDGGDDLTESISNVMEPSQQQIKEAAIEEELDTAFLLNSENDI